MEIDKVFSSDVDGVADNLFSAVKNSVSEIKAMQQRKAAENVQLVIQALKKIESDLQDKFDGVTTVIEKRVATIKDGRDGLDGRNGRDGKDGRPGRDGAPGARGPAGVPGTNGRDGEDGVSVTDARIDFDGSLIISLSSGREINVGEVVAPDLAEKIKVITNGGGTSQSVLDTLASLQAQITAISNFGYVNYVGTWNANTNSPTITSGSGDKGDYYVVSVAGSTNIDGQTLWGVGDWIIFNGSVWQKVDGGSTGDFTTINVADLSITNTATLDNAKYLRSKTSGGSNIRMLGITALDSAYIGPMDSGPSSLLVNVSPTSTSVEFYASGSERARITSAGLTLSGGTANGVAYLNGSKVLTTGSALTYSGGALLNTGSFAPTDGTNIGEIKINAATLDFNTSSSAVPQVFRLGSAEQMRLTSTGLGIGTSSLYAKLTSKGTGGAATTTYKGIFNAYNADVDVGLSIGGYNSSPYAMYIQALDPRNGFSTTYPLSLNPDGGNVGIGTNSPAYKLDAVGQIRAQESGTGSGDGNLIGATSGANGNAGVLFQTGGSSRWNLTTQGTNGANLRIYNYTLGATVATFDSSGNLGIGTSSPGAKLETSSTSAGATVEVLRLSNPGAGANTQAQLKFFTASTNYGTISGGYGASAPQMIFDLPNGTPGNYVWQISSSEKMRLDASGLLTVGNTSPAGSSQITAYGASNGQIAVQNSTNWSRLLQNAGDLYIDNGVGGSAGNIIFRSSSSTTERARIDSSGNLGIGCVPGSIWPSATSASGDNGSTFRKTYVSVSSNASILQYLNRNDGDGTITQFYRTGTAVGSISVTSTATAYNTSSDYRLKHDIAPMTGALAKVAALKPCTYKWNADDSAGQGFIAHELAEVVPQAVTGAKDAVDEEGNPVYQGIDASFLVATLTAAIQELKAEFDAYKATHP